MDESAPRTPSTEPRFDRRTLMALAGGLAVAAIEAKAGRDYFWGPPVIADGLVLVGSGSGAELPTARGRMTAYSLRDGSLVWSTPTVPPGANGGGVIAPASVDLRAGLAYVATGSPYRAVPGPNLGTDSLIALRLDDGAIVWSDQIHPGDTHGFDFNSAPVILGRVLVAASKDGFHAWDRVSRRRLWHRQLPPALSQHQSVAGPTNGPEGGPVATDGRRVYVLSNDAAHNSCVAAALAPATGRVLWHRGLSSFSFAAPAVAGAPSTGAPAVAEGRLVVGAGAEPFLPGHLLVCIGGHRSRTGSSK